MAMIAYIATEHPAKSRAGVWRSRPGPVSTQRAVPSSTQCGNARWQLERNFDDRHHRRRVLGVRSAGVAAPATFHWSLWSEKPKGCCVIVPATVLYGAWVWWGFLMQRSNWVSADVEFVRCLPAV